MAASHTAATVEGPGKKGHLGGFWALIATQMQGAFNDNLYRYIIVYYMIDRAAKSGHSEQSVAMQLTALGTILFAIPYLAFPGLAGALSDRFSKRSVTIWTKLWEVMVMVVGLMAFWTQNAYLIFFLLYLVFMQSAFFSPSKYGILPELLPEEKLSWGNGILGMTTFATIIAGQGVAGLFYEYVKQDKISLDVPSVVLIGLSFIGLATSWCVTKVPPACPTRVIPINPWQGLGRYFKEFYRDRLLWLTFTCGSFFWFMGAIIQQNVVPHGLSALKTGEFRASVLAASVMVGIAAGSMGAGYLSRRKIELGLVPLGLIGMALSSLVLGMPALWDSLTQVVMSFTGLSEPLQASFYLTLFFLFLVGFFGGFFEVPVAAMLQYRSPVDIRGGMIAVFNIGTCVGIFLAGGLYMAAGKFGFTSYHVFLLCGVFCLAMCVYLALRFPLLVVRSFSWVLTNTVYRLRVRGGDNVPARAGGLIVVNHRSFADAMALMASTDRPVRFLVSPDYIKVGWLRILARVMQAIPIDNSMDRGAFQAALDAAHDAIRDGELVCILADVDLHQADGKVPNRKDFTSVLRELDAPIIPVCIDRLLGDVYEVVDGRYRWKLPPQIPYSISVTFGEPMASDSAAFDVRQRLQQLDVEAFNELKQPLVHRAFVRGARRHPFRMAMADLRMPKCTYGFALISSIALARKLRDLLDDQPMVGVLIPQSVGGALVNIALQFMGKVPVNLNYTASAQAMASAAKRCEITQTITSKAFLDRMPVTVPGKAILAEDIKESLTSKDRFIALIMALFFPVRLIEKAVGSRSGRTSDDLATVIFSSGSEGEPKGVMLTQFNITSNCDGMLRTFPHGPGDVLMGILPLFHSFGFTGTMWAPLLGGMSIVFHPNPLEAKAVGSLCGKYRGKFLICTATFCQAYIRRCQAEDFKSLKYVITGAEKLPARVREAFLAKFGVEPLEGYGTTECAPVVSFNMPDVAAPGFVEVNSRHGTIGKPITSVAVRTADQDTGEPLREDEVGMLQVKGPNIMVGYLGMPEKTAAVLKDGWYNTGDIASVSVDGFTTITDRLARFSKIGGEMVPHGRIEDVLHEILGLTEQSLVVTGVPDHVKGERLVVLHTLTDEQVDTALQKLGETDLPKLWLPRPGAFYRIDEIPVLGTGKTDIRAVREKAKMLDLGE